ncbi:MAG: PH domain-containing protein [Clostridiales bacterium]|nr:PH domain-containing protein [Clostridiales bacterium]
MKETWITLFRPFTPTLPRGIHPQAVNMWRVSTAIWAVVLAILILIADVLILLFALEADVEEFLPLRKGWALFPLWAKGLFVGEAAVFALWFFLSFFIAPPLRQARFRYELRENELEVESGIWTMERRLIPYARVQHVDLEQGPIARLYGLAEVVIATAAGSTSIPALSLQDAEKLRDLVAEKAGIADAF